MLHCTSDPARWKIRSGQQADRMQNPFQSTPNFLQIFGQDNVCSAVTKITFFEKWKRLPPQFPGRRVVFVSKKSRRCSILYLSSWTTTYLICEGAFRFQWELYGKWSHTSGFAMFMSPLLGGVWYISPSMALRNYGNSRFFCDVSKGTKMACKSSKE